MTDAIVDYDDYEEYVHCDQCGGEGGYASCMEDCCPYEGGEEMCDDPACWRRCDICEGKGGWKREEPSVSAQAPATGEDA